MAHIYFLVLVHYFVHVLLFSLLVDALHRHIQALHHLEYARCEVVQNLLDVLLLVHCLRIIHHWGAWFLIMHHFVVIVGMWGYVGWSVLLIWLWRQFNLTEAFYEWWFKLFCIDVLRFLFRRSEVNSVLGLLEHIWNNTWSTYWLIRLARICDWHYFLVRHAIHILEIQVLNFQQFLSYELIVGSILVI